MNGYEVGDTVKIVEEDRFDSNVSEGDIFQVQSTNPDNLFPKTIEIYPLESDFDDGTQIAFTNWIKKVS